MIRLLRLRNWRSYERLDLRLDPGTTFVVAPNGVGKTSLVYALAWAVFGQYSSVDPKACIRAGAESAQVDVELDLPDGRRLGIRRTAKRRGAPAAVYEIQGTGVSESSALEMMEDAFGIDLPVASRLSMMMGGGHLAASDTLDLEDHLHRAFGIAHLLEAAETAQSVSKDSEKARADLRSTTKQRLEDREALERHARELETELSLLRETGAQLETARGIAAEQRSLVERQSALSSELEQYEQHRMNLVMEAEALLGRAAPSDSIESIRSALQAELEATQRTIDEVTEGVVVARSAVAIAEQAIGLLNEEKNTVCPTCLRTLPLHERESAISGHLAQQRTAQADADGLGDRQLQTQRYAQGISGLLARLQALRPPTLESQMADVPTKAAADSMYEQALSAVDEHNQQVGRVQSRIESLMEQIDSDDKILREQQNLQLAYRREAAALAGARVLRAAANHLIESRIEPMASDVRQRWKHLFTSNGLTFRPDGSITRHRDGQELSWDTLSGGERTWARIVTHLIVMAATTSLPFAWFDEPLEHLDPQLRHAVAATLAKATVGGAPRQLLVTTYEHGIAQQLAEQAEGVALVALRESGNVEGG